MRLKTGVLSGSGDAADCLHPVDDGTISLHLDWSV